MRLVGSTRTMVHNVQFFGADGAYNISSLSSHLVFNSLSRR